METRPCTQCGVQIHASSRRCVLCGALQAPASRWPDWTPWVLVLGGLVLAVVAAGAITGGLSASGSKSGGPRFRIVSASGLTTLVPVGWTGRPQVVGPGTVTLAFGDPRRPEFALAITAARPARGSARSRARAVQDAATRRLDYVPGFFGRILFPGGRPAWLVAYDSDGLAHVDYVDTACVPGVAMRVEVSAPDRAGLAGIAEPVAASAGPLC